jgi:hypothetical protein
MIAQRMLGVGAVLLLASAAQAGPVVQWSYSSAFESRGGNGNYSGSVVSGGNIHSTLLADLTGATGGASGGQTVTVGTLTPGTGVSPANSVPTSYRFALSLTDAASGETGTLTYYGRAGETTTWEDVPFTETPLSRHLMVASLGTSEVWWNPDLKEQTLTLGGHEYRVNLHTRSDPDGVAFGNAYIDADVRIGGPSETPEPGTLVLAGLAVAGGIGAWVRRKNR